MLSKLSLLIAERFVKNNKTSYDEIEIYQYGFFVLISEFVFLLISLVLGLLFNALIQSLILYFSFFIIRKYAGGYHASTETRCEIFTTLSILACAVVIRISQTHDFRIALLIIAIISAVLIGMLCPLDTPEKPLSEKEFKYFRKISWIILFVIVSLIVLSYCFKIKLAFVPLCMSLILESVLLIGGKIKNIVLKRKECRN